jgi:mono/diheme cytochrome c family protein
MPVTIGHSHRNPGALKQQRMRKYLILAACLVVTACASAVNPLDDYEELDATTIFDAPAGVDVAPENREQVARGKYLVELMGCGACHTDGALIGEARMDRWLAGSRIGIAYTNPMEFRKPGVVFPPNITPDDETGIGRWSDRQIASAVREGSGRHGQARILVMPWQGYSRISDSDMMAIVGYLRSIQPVSFRVPANVPPGRSTSESYVHFGVYRSR